MTYKLPIPQQVRYVEEDLYSEAQVLQAYRDGLEAAAGECEGLCMAYAMQDADVPASVAYECAEALRALKEQA